MKSTIAIAAMLVSTLAVSQTTYQRIGNTTFISNGKTCQTIGSQTFCN